jgi:hypothetical protein
MNRKLYIHIGGSPEYRINEYEYKYETLLLYSHWEWELFIRGRHWNFQYSDILIG